MGYTDVIKGIKGNPGGPVVGRVIKTGNRTYLELAVGEQVTNSMGCTQGSTVRVLRGEGEDEGKLMLVPDPGGSYILQHRRALGKFGLGLLVRGDLIGAGFNARLQGVPYELTAEGLVVDVRGMISHG